MPQAYLNRIATAVPDNDVHASFIAYAPTLLTDPRRQVLLKRMISKAQIEHRYSFVKPPTPDGESASDPDVLFHPGRFPDTACRMQFFERHAFALARKALDRLELRACGHEITHLILTTCTGFYAPGIDLQVVEHYGLRPSVERTVIGFMGCYAALNALKLARHIVRSEPDSKVLILNLELCTLHLQEKDDLEQLLAFLIFADGCAASLISRQPVGLELQSFSSTVIPSTAEQISWRIGALGFDMVLLGSVPQIIAKGLPNISAAVLAGGRPEDIEHWAVHPGGRTILDAVQAGLGIAEEKLTAARKILRCYGNMSSATVMFVLEDMMRAGMRAGRGCGMAFGPGLTVESMAFRPAA